MAKKTQRAFALIAAIAFLLSTVAFTVIVVWSARQQNKADNTNEEATSVDSDTNTPTLAGTKLKDFDPISGVDDLQKIDIKVGDGQEVTADSVVTVHYTGALAKNGLIFESSLDGGQPVSFGLAQVISGWSEGLPGMKVGGSRRLLIPSAKAYGAQSPSADIPANSDLVFDVELLSIQ